MKKIGYAFLGSVVLFSVCIIISTFMLKETLNPQIIREGVDSYGALAPAVLMLVLIALCFISIIPNTPFVIAAGYMFGTFLGAVYVILSVVIGASLVFVVAKKYGRPFVERMVKKRDLARTNLFVKKWGIWALVMERLIPMFPANIVGLSFGLTEMRYRTFIKISLLVIIPGAIIQSGFGDIVSNIENVNIVLVGLALLLTVAVVCILAFRRRIFGFIKKEIQILEKDMETVKKK